MDPTGVPEQQRAFLGEHGIRPGADGFGAEQLAWELGQRGWVGTELRPSLDVDGQYDATVRKCWEPSTSLRLRGTGPTAAAALASLVAQAIMADDEATREGRKPAPCPS